MKIKGVFLDFLYSHLISYPTPINLSYMWSFGFLGGICLVWQIITGVFLAQHYVPHIDLAFSSVEHIMRDVNYGWFLRYGHANGASMFFIIIYIHMFRGLYYCSYFKPRQYLWMSGVIIFLLMMGTAFLGYVLPWGQMSFWGATVITNLVSSIPVVGEDIVQWLWGGFSVASPTLNRFFSFHYTIPFIILGLVVAHLALLHRDGSTNPIRVPNVECVPFYPYYYVKDLFSLTVLSFFFLILLFYFPNLLGHRDNYILGGPMATPEHIVPEWYFLPFYAILRTVPSKFGGILLMFGAILVLLVLPMIHYKDGYQSTQHRRVFSTLYWLLFFDFFILGWIGQKEVEAPFDTIGLIATIYYFSYFLIIAPNILEIEAKIENFISKIFGGSKAE